MLTINCSVSSDDGHMVIMPDSIELDHCELCGDIAEHFSGDTTVLCAGCASRCCEEIY